MTSRERVKTTLWRSGGLCWNIREGDGGCWTHSTRKAHALQQGVHWWGEMPVSPEAVVEKVRAWLIPENMEEVQGLVGIWKFREDFDGVRSQKAPLGFWEGTDISCQQRKRSGHLEPVPYSFCLEITWVTSTLISLSKACSVHALNIKARKCGPTVRLRLPPLIIFLILLGLPFILWFSHLHSFS